MKRCYCAAKLSSPDVCKYLQNVSANMVQAEELRQLGVSVFVPAVDLLMGIKFGNYEYSDFFDYGQMWLDASDFVYLTPNWETSKGTRREIERATEKGIPVFDNINQVKEFLKPVIICIVGESGSGKTLMAEWFEKLFGYHLIQSYTTRPRRTPDENGHTFVTDEAFDLLEQQEEMIASTQWGDVRYCCLRKDVKDFNTYVIDEHGLNTLWERYADVFHIFDIRVQASLGGRAAKVGIDRVKRDKDKFTMNDNEFDYLFQNHYDLKELITFVEQTQKSIRKEFISYCLHQ